MCVLIPLPLHMCPQVDEVLSSGSVTRLIVTPRQGTRYQHAAYVQVCVCVSSVFPAFFWRVSSVFLFVSTCRALPACRLCAVLCVCVRARMGVFWLPH